ncbi:MAG: CPBP family intramembrane glutamic endopeptidase [Cyanobacteria bacterium P01_G01_bin.39]
MTIFASYLIIPLLLMPIFLISVGFIVGFERIDEYYENSKNFSTSFELLSAIALSWYFFNKLKAANINHELILGSSKGIDFKLPILLVVTQYLFVWGINPITLYALSFIVPKYVETRLNYEYASTPISWVLFSILALVYAPIMEELFFRGIIFQKLAIKQGVTQAIVISAILFAAIHFRYDIIPLSG